MSASLVGSEMCIRDRHSWRCGRAPRTRAEEERRREEERREGKRGGGASVSYTHLTLPTNA
eukprot:13559198-Alexandrium_andersonii.AAC.1